MRNADFFTNEMKKFSSDVRIKYKVNKIDGKSILNLMAAGIENGSDITVECSGADEEKTMDAAAEIIEGGFFENE